MRNEKLWTYLSSVAPEEKKFVDAFLSNAEEIAATGVCATPRVAEGGDVDGVSVAVEEDGETVAAVCVFGRPDDVAERRDELVDILLKHRGAHG